MESNQQSGNVLFLILIAVALFAALSYAVTSSTRNGGGSVSKDKARTNAASILQFGTTLRNAVMRLKISNGCTDTTLDFSNNIFITNGGTAITSANSNAPLNKSCNIFDVAGGNLTPVVPMPDALDLNNPSVSIPTDNKLGHINFGAWQMKGIGTDGTTGDAATNDIIMIQNFLNRETCIAINEAVGVNNPGGEPPAIANTGGGGLYINGDLSGTRVINDTNVNGQPAFCRYWSAKPTYQFMMVLVER